jgi:hypothetical protein
MTPQRRSQARYAICSACNIDGFAVLAFATSRVELTLNANLLPSKVASPSRGDAADPATNGTVPQTVSFALVEQF